MKILIWLGTLILVILVVGAVWLAVRGESAQEPESTLTESPIVEREKSMDSGEEGEEGVVARSPEAASAPIEAAELEAVGTYAGSGEAARTWDGSTFMHVVTAEIPDPPVDKFYEGWLVDSEPTLRFFSTGKMSKQGNTYALIYSDSQNYPEYNEVVITEETLANGLDGQPEAHVLEGSF